MLAKFLLHLRYLQPSFPVARFSSLKPVEPTRVITIFSRIFPHNLKYQSFSNTTMRKFSARSGRVKTASGLGKEVRASKSLVDSEAELSGWVSGLGSDSSKKTRLYSDSDKEGGNERRRDGFGKGRGGGRGGGRGRGRGMEERGGKRKRDGGFGDVSESSRQGGNDSMERFVRKRGGNGERFSGGLRGKGRFGGEVEGRREKKRCGGYSRSRFWMEEHGGNVMRSGEKGERGRGVVALEKDEKSYGNFKSLLGSDEDSDELDDDDDDDDDEEEEEEEEEEETEDKETVLAQPVSGRDSSADMPGTSASYLSETR